MSEFLHRSFDFKSDALELLRFFQDEPYLFFLDSSARPHGTLGRYSFIGFDPFRVFSGHGENIVDGLKRNYEKVKPLSPTALTPLPAGAVGFLSYDAGRYWENIARRAKPDLKMPEAVFGFYDVTLTVDHWKKKLVIVSTGLPEKGLLRRRRAKERLENVAQKIEKSLPLRDRDIAAANRIGRQRLDLKSNFTRAQYYTAIKKILEYIEEGDVYQVNLAQRFEYQIKNKKVHPVDVYASLRRQSPAYFMSYFAGKDFNVLSSSPERFLQLNGRKVVTRPMKGTRPRATDRTQDLRHKQALTLSKKDKAELLMVTDLERNDLGRVCEFGSVRVKSLRDIESYRTVFQATSTVEGTLRRDKDAFDLLRACFPGGSITGCPKIRAMQIIEELEPHPRGIYTGILGYLSFSGDMDFNVLIRTVLMQKNKIFFHAGGGIVADSTPQAEYAETLVKAKAMRDGLSAILSG